MGYFHSKTTHLLRSPDHPSLPDTHKPDPANGDQAAAAEPQVPAFKEYSVDELRKATNGFSSDCIVSESGEKAPNVVYRGKLDGNRFELLNASQSSLGPTPSSSWLRLLEWGS